jgi:hypothetical protein
MEDGLTKSQLDVAFNRLRPGDQLKRVSPGDTVWTFVRWLVIDSEDRAGLFRAPSGYEATFRRINFGIGDPTATGWYVLSGPDKECW